MEVRVEEKAARDTYNRHMSLLMKNRRIMGNRTSELRSQSVLASFNGDRYGSPHSISNVMRDVNEQQSSMRSGSQHKLKSVLKDIQTAKSLKEQYATLAAKNAYRKEGLANGPNTMIPLKK